ncbi:hypothetical protein CEUSTIGMA_g12191.t1 [Chlamydomonas eustigma]|uniref:Uncharacterized protein n=1 Tax=Chlamydomonas eustigma TaxID=1157962 RepID=A0A250XP98_9CHLO|nr:hypothetical protein CEUSTIGMA_g12191.t1 [Chlamydomonas eustigma]|eukprot:GAX84769.1 hypothetical protein CEUSTIGMA_g12191.t1 [Chlamydomonas eustigma]
MDGGQLKRRAFVPSGGFGDLHMRYYPFEDASGKAVCWRIGRESADAFIARSSFVGAKDRLFVGSKVRVFFPVKEKYFVDVTDRGLPAWHVTNEAVWEAVGPTRICHLLIRRVGGGNHVYART